MVEQIVLYVAVLGGGLAAGIGLSMMCRSGERSTPWLAVVLIVFGSAWTVGVVRGIERAHRPVIVVRVVLDKPSG